jgi:phosphate:Na+ symporter
VTGHAILLNLLGGVALLVWATRMVKTGVLRAFGERFRRLIAHATAGPVRACLTGVAVSTAVQSSSATALIVVSFVERGLVALAPALALMLGADIGSTLVVQALSLNLAALVPLLLIAGVALFMLSSSATAQQVGRIVIGLALMVVSLGMVVGASQSLRESAGLAIVLERLAEDPILAIVIGAGLTWLLHSSVAFVLLVISLAGAGVLGPASAMALVLGANIGSGLIPIGLSGKAPAPTRRVLFGNLAFRLFGAVAAFAVLDWAVEGTARFEADRARQVADFHTAFNLALALVFLPLTPVAAGLLERWVPQTQPPGSRRSSISTRRSSTVRRWRWAARRAN